jgi:DNA mismatch repair protein MutS
LETLVARESQTSGIENLRCGFNRVFGYYLETTRANLPRVPKHWTPCQSLKNAERFNTPELKTFESKALGAKDKAYEREYALFIALRDRVAGDIRRIQRTANLIALVDVLAAFALLGTENCWVRPRIVDGATFDIVGGRHPVLEALLREGPDPQPIVANDIVFGDDTTLAVLTGPNMSGKSTYIRMAALSVLMGQIGCGVAAQKATFAPVDRVFTRIGASDDLTRGVSTFMVEMIEVATILRHATPASLVVLDEVGRGTSTYDGVAIAWALAEHLVKTVRARTLFATHYHELTALARDLGGVKNLTVMVEEWGEEVVFLHKIADGAAKRSYGVQVARLAGVPPAVVERARTILHDLEMAPPRLRGKGLGRRGESPGQGHLFFQSDAAPPAPAPPAPPVDPAATELADQLRGTNLDTLTPLQALALLATWKDRLG